jgi:hypothetical protein
METKIFRAACQNIENEINSLPCPNPHISPISDGIVNPEKYLNSKLKILWILKESNDVENNEGGGWSLTDTINKINNWEEQVQKGNSYRTLQRMIYTTFGLLNNFIPWQEIPSIYNSEVFEAYKQMGYINIKKIPGINRVSANQIQIAYDEYKEILLKQLATYKPDVIIGGNTLSYFYEDLGFNEMTKKTAEVTTFYSDYQRIYVDAYHPAFFSVKEQIFCDEIITGVKNWLFYEKNNTV